MQLTICFGEGEGHVGETGAKTRWGGARSGSGRKRRDRGVSHATREQITKHDPVLVTWKRKRSLRGFRQANEAHVIVEAIKLSRKADFRIAHFSIQRDHLHFILEADSREVFANGMRGFGCRLAKALNKLWRRSGKVFAGRFHSDISELCHLSPFGSR